ncbi:MAG: MCE family protein [Phycisphaeraceae bacterium]|nr:MCE family protein [Phycisphaeraceae bacterium]
MNARLRDFIVGLTSIVALVGFAALLLLFGELASLWQTRYPLVVRANTSAGLRVGSQVTVNGVVVGTVQDVSLDLNDREHPVRILALIDERFDVPLDARPAVAISLLGGGQRLDLQVPSTFEGEVRMASRTAPSVILGRFESLGDILDQVKNAAVNASSAIARLEGSFDEVGSLMERAGNAFDGVGRAAGQAQETLAKADLWLGDEQMREDIRGTLFNARQATAAIARIADGVEVDAPKLLASLTRASDQLSVSLREIDRLIVQAREGQGTVGRLMSNPDLYQNLNDAAQRLSAVLREAQLLLQKVKQEGLDIKF